VREGIELRLKQGDPSTSWSVAMNVNRKHALSARGVGRNRYGGPPVRRRSARAAGGGALALLGRPAAFVVTNFIVEPTRTTAPQDDTDHVRE
jgi:hypothetical protein